MTSVFLDWIDISKLDMNIPIDNVMNIICLPENREIEVRTMETTFSPDELHP